MNDLDALRSMRSTVPEPGVDALRDAEGRFMTAARAHTAGRSGRGRRRAARPVPLWTTAASGLALTTVIALAVYAGVPNGHVRARDPGGQRGSGPAMLPAAELLDRAAAAAEQTPELTPGPNQFIVYTTVSKAIVVGTAESGRPWSYLSSSRTRIWLSASGKREGALSRLTLHPEAVQGEPIPADALHDVGKTRWDPLPVCDRRPAADSRTDYAYLSTLPTDPVKMLKVLQHRQSGEPSPDVRAWTAAGDILRDSYLPPAQRAAIFRALKLIAGATVVDAATDGAGRPGTAVAWTNKHSGVRDELVFDATTYRFHGERAVVVDPARANIPGVVLAAPISPIGKPASTVLLRAGTELFSTAQLSMTVADTAPRVPHTTKYCG